MRDQMIETRHWLDAFLAPGAEVSPATRVKLLLGAGCFAWRLDDYGPARARLAECLALAREQDDAWAAAYALHFRAHIEDAQGELAQAVRTYEEALPAFRTFGGWDLAKALHCLATSLRKQGDLVRARALLEETVAVGKAIGGLLWGMAYPLFGLGLIAERDGDHARARALFEEGLALAHEAGDRPGAAFTQLHLGDTAHREREHARAAALYRASLATWHDIGDRQNGATCLEALAQLALAQHEPARAARLLAAVEQLLHSIGGALPPAERAAHARSVAGARAVLGPEAFEAAWRRGRAMSVREAVDYAMEADGEH